MVRSVRTYSYNYNYVGREVACLEFEQFKQCVISIRKYLFFNSMITFIS